MEFEFLAVCTSPCNCPQYMEFEYLPTFTIHLSLNVENKQQQIPYIGRTWDDVPIDPIYHIHLAKLHYFTNPEHPAINRGCPLRTIHFGGEKTSCFRLFGRYQFDETDYHGMM